jgi:hypothetical protein
MSVDTTPHPSPPRSTVVGGTALDHLLLARGLPDHAVRGLYAMLARCAGAIFGDDAQHLELWLACTGDLGDRLVTAAATVLGSHVVPFAAALWDLTTDQVPAATLVYRRTPEDPVDMAQWLAVAAGHEFDLHATASSADRLGVCMPYGGYMSLPSLAHAPAGLLASDARASVLQSVVAFEFSGGDASPSECVVIAAGMRAAIATAVTDIAGLMTAPLRVSKWDGLRPNLWRADWATAIV